VVLLTGYTAFFGKIQGATKSDRFLQDIKNGDAAVISAVLDGPDGIALLSHPQFAQGITPVHAAAAYGHLGILTQLLQRGGLQLAEVPDDEKRTALDVATGAAWRFLKQVQSCAD
jgi:ankyrin repeat protein